MPRTKTDAIHRFFTYNADSNTSKCHSCGKDIKGKHSTNLKNHMSIKHADIFLNVMNINKEMNKSKLSTAKTNTVTNNIIKLCADLVVIHGRPLKMIDDEAFQNIINLAIALNAKTKHIKANRVKELILDQASEIKLKIATEVRNKLVCLKLDSVTYKDRNFVGINVQYINGGEIITRNLRIVELNQNKTGEIKDHLLKVLEDFQIATDQLYCIITDNSNNMNTRKILENSEEPPSKSLEADDENSSHNDDVESMMNEENDDSDEDSKLKVINFCENNIFSLNEVAIEKFIDVNENMFRPRVMLCAAHILQLAVNDCMLVNQESRQCLENARKAVKILHKSNLDNILRLLQLPKPSLDVAARWTSTFNMLTHLVRLKEICQKICELSNELTPQFWSEIRNMVDGLQPVYELNVMLLTKEHNIGDFYIAWITCKTKVESLRSDFAASLCYAMRRVEKKLLMVDVVLEALYMDERLNVLLSDEECDKARSLLSEVFKQTQRLEQADDSDNNTENIDLKYLKNNLAHKSKGSITLSSGAFHSSLMKLRSTKRLSLTDKITHHWNNQPENCLSVVAKTVLTTSASQVSVRKLLSLVKFMLSSQTHFNKPMFLQDIILVKSNHNLLK